MPPHQLPSQVYQELLKVDSWHPALQKIDIENILKIIEI